MCESIGLSWRAHLIPQTFSGRTRYAALTCRVHGFDATSLTVWVSCRRLPGEVNDGGLPLAVLKLLGATQGSKLRYTTCGDDSVRPGSVTLVHSVPYRVGGRIGLSQMI